MKGRDILGCKSPSPKQCLFLIKKTKQSSLRGKNAFKGCHSLKVQSFKKTAGQALTKMEKTYLAKSTSPFLKTLLRKYWRQ